MAFKAVKDPNAKLDYGFDWSAWLDGDTISASSWTVPTGLTQSVSPAPSFSATTTTIWLEGGTAGEKYSVSNHITTTAGRQDDRTIVVSVKEL